MVTVPPSAPMRNVAVPETGTSDELPDVLVLSETPLEPFGEAELSELPFFFIAAAPAERSAENGG